MRCVDLFAGWGGFTLAANQAGAQVLWAGNHWPLAVEAHRAANPDPETIHVCQDLRQADWGALPEYDVLLASPACQGHSQAAQPSRAKSGRTRRYHDNLRATAWSVVDCAEVTLPRALVVENVPDFARWKLYPLWCAALEALGYQLAERKLTASLHSDTPQRRQRLFVVATRDGSDPHAVLDLPTRRKEPPIGPHLDWTAGRWRDVASAGPRVRERIAAAQANHGPRCLSQHVTGHPGVGLHEPIRTITTKDQWALVDGARYRPLTIRENARGQGFPDSYGWPAHATRRDTIKGIGNAAPPKLARAVIERLGASL